MRAPLPLAFVCVLLAGCATPDLRPFAEQTARLATAVSGEQRQIALKFDQVIELNHEACEKSRRATPAIRKPQPCADEADRRRQAADYAESRRIIDAMLEKSVAYAASLAELAAAGETGGAAAQSLLGSLQQFGKLVGVGGTAVTATVATPLEKVGIAVTRVQAQRSLADAAAAGLGRLKEIAASMSAAGPALDAATAIAVQGAKKLLFPKVAKSAESMLAAVQELKKAADELKGQVENARELGDLPTLLANVQALLEKLKARANSLQG